MKKFIFALALSSLAFMGRMSDDAAKSKAITYWSSHAATAKFWWSGGGGQWIYQVGCYDPTYGFHVTGQSTSSWEAAYANVDPAKNGSFVLKAVTATQSDGQKTIINPNITFYGCDATFKNQTQIAVAEK